MKQIRISIVFFIFFLGLLSFVQAQTTLPPSEQSPKPDMVQAQPSLEPVEEGERALYPTEYQLREIERMLSEKREKPEEEKPEEQVSSLEEYMRLARQILETDANLQTLSPERLRDIILIIDAGEYFNPDPLTLEFVIGALKILDRRRIQRGIDPITIERSGHPLNKKDTVVQDLEKRTDRGESPSSRPESRRRRPKGRR